MVKVTIEGWDRGLNKIELNHLLRRHAHLGLGDAKRLVDRVLAGEIVSFSVTGVDEARLFCSSAKLVGADCSFVHDEVSSASLS